MIVLFKDLRERPAALLQPKAPKPGKRIFLEYITPLWSRLSFNQKSVIEISSDTSQECLWRLSELLAVLRSDGCGRGIERFSKFCLSQTIWTDH